VYFLPQLSSHILTAKRGTHAGAGPNGRCVVDAQGSSDSPRRIFQVVGAANVVLENVELTNGWLVQVWPRTLGKQPRACLCQRAAKLFVVPAWACQAPVSLI
jgi:hypothetical protein